MRQMRGAFSLLEVILAVTIAAIAMSTATLGMVGLSEESKLRSAAMDLASLLRLSRAQASATGRPVALRIGQNDCEVLKPMKPDGQWVLAPMLRRELRGSVRVERILFGSEKPVPLTIGAVEQIWVSPEGVTDLTVYLHVGQHGRARATIDAWIGLKEIAFLDDDSD